MDQNTNENRGIYHFPFSLLEPINPTTDKSMKVSGIWAMGNLLYVTNIANVIEHTKSFLRNKEPKEVNFNSATKVTNCTRAQKRFHCANKRCQ